MERRRNHSTPCRQRDGYSAIRLRRLLVEERPVIDAYDEALFAKRLNYNERDIAPALEAFRAAR